MLHLGDDTLRAAYARDGFVKIPNLISRDEATSLRSAIIELASQPPPELTLSFEPGAAEDISTVRKARNLGRFSDLIRTFCISHPIVGVAKRLIGEPLGFYGDQALFKGARVGSAKPLHQDAAYFRIQPPDFVITFWCALDDADVDNGCMHYAPGSHLGGVVEHKLLPDTPHLVAQLSPQALVAVPVRRGDCVAHGSATLHSTPPNTSDRPRLALLAHYVRLDAQFPPRSAQATPVIPV